ncbi:MAG: hypothetical protein IAF02_06365 [Anaerolineae bacterium]|nr:hypothetical protein [Anaerolineae bacterium]
MSDAIEAISIGFSVALIFSIPFAFFAFMRYLRYKETIALAERGLLRPQRRSNGRQTTKWGFVISAFGLAFTCGLWPLGFMPDAPQFPLGFGPWMLIGLLPLFFGIALICIGELSREDELAQDAIEDIDPIPPHKMGG